jgi:hypothetical protein
MPVSTTGTESASPLLSALLLDGADSSQLASDFHRDPAVLLERRDPAVLLEYLAGAPPARAGHLNALRASSSPWRLLAEVEWLHRLACDLTPGGLNIVFTTAGAHDVGARVSMIGANALPATRNALLVGDYVTQISGEDVRYQTLQGSLKRLRIGRVRLTVQRSVEVVSEGGSETGTESYVTEVIDSNVWVEASAVATWPHRVITHAAVDEPCAIFQPFGLAPSQIKLASEAAREMGTPIARHLLVRKTQQSSMGDRPRKHWSMKEAEALFDGGTKLDWVSLAPLSGPAEEQQVLDPAVINRKEATDLRSRRGLPPLPPFHASGWTQCNDWERVVSSIGTAVKVPAPILEVAAQLNRLGLDESSINITLDGPSAPCITMPTSFAPAESVRVRTALTGSIVRPRLKAPGVILNAVEVVYYTIGQARMLGELTADCFHPTPDQEPLELGFVFWADGAPIGTRGQVAVGGTLVDLDARRRASAVEGRRYDVLPASRRIFKKLRSAYMSLMDFDGSEEEVPRCAGPLIEEEVGKMCSHVFEVDELRFKVTLFAMNPDKKQLCIAGTLMGASSNHRALHSLLTLGKFGIVTRHGYLQRTLL